MIYNFILLTCCKGGCSTSTLFLPLNIPSCYGSDYLIETKAFHNQTVILSLYISALSEL